jgi:sulfide dehydrogenase [flavocytochrome c] flavoprotein subunit
MVDGYKGGKMIKIKGSGGLSPSGADAAFRQKEADYTRGWYDSITQDIWG